MTQGDAFPIKTRATVGYLVINYEDFMYEDGKITEIRDIVYANESFQFPELSSDDDKKIFQLEDDVDNEYEIMSSIEEAVYVPSGNFESVLAPSDNSGLEKRLQNIEQYLEKSIETNEKLLKVCEKNAASMERNAVAVEAIAKFLCTIKVEEIKEE
jgi:hypothetical protein